MTDPIALALRVAGILDEHRTSFNLIDDMGLKVDFFVLGDSLLDQLQLERRRRILVRNDPPQYLWVTAPAEQVLRKLEWYEAGAAPQIVSGATSWGFCGCNAHRSTLRGCAARRHLPDSPNSSQWRSGTRVLCTDVLRQADFTYQVFTNGDYIG